MDIRFGPDGALYYLSFDGGTLSRISFAGGSNRQPVATVTATPDSGESPLTVTFDASASFDPDGRPLTFGWDFGDGTGGNGPVVTNQYSAGSYSASLTVTDSDGGESLVRGIRIVAGNTRPTPLINVPPDGQLYTEGEVIQFSGVAFDREAWYVPCQRFSWSSSSITRVIPIRFSVLSKETAAAALSSTLTARTRRSTRSDSPSRTTVGRSVLKGS